MKAIKILRDFKDLDTKTEAQNNDRLCTWIRCNLCMMAKFGEYGKH